MLLSFFFLSTLVAVARTEFVSREPETLEARLDRVADLLSEVPLIDGHNDLAMDIHDIVNNQLALFPFDKNLTELYPWASDKYSQTDLFLLNEGMVGAQFWSAWVPCNSGKINSVVQGMEQIDVIRRLIEKYSDDLQFADSTKGIIDAFANGKIASLIGVEGGHMIDNSLAIVRAFYQLGVRYLTLTHSCSTRWAGSSFDQGEENKVTRLTDFGKLLVREMNRLGMIIDIAHTTDATMRDVLGVTAAPVIFSHNNARGICNDRRNVPDEILTKLSANGGIIMINFFPLFLTCNDSATLYDVMDHINYVKNLTGFNTVGIGSDFNGINRVPEGLEDVSKYPYLFAELMLDPEWTDLNLKKLAGLNFLRVFRLVESIKSVLEAEHPMENTIADNNK